MPLAFLSAQESIEDSNEIRQNITFELANGIQWSRYSLSGPYAWDRLSLTSLETKLITKGSIPFREGEYLTMILGVTRPLIAKTTQLDGINVTLDTSADSMFYGAYNLWGYSKEWNIGMLYMGYYGGPSIDFYYYKMDSLTSLGIDGGVKWGVSIGEHLYSGMEIQAGFDLWGSHSLGDSARYDGKIRDGINASCIFFMGYR